MEWLTQEKLKHFLHYDPITGIWTWRTPLLRSKMQSGDIAGRITAQGRRQIRISGCFFYASRLAWLYMTGKWPESQIDHINRIKDDDRWINLREATQSQNSYNRDWCEDSGEWRGITVHGNKFAVNIGNHYLGLFDTLDDAMKVRDIVLKLKAGDFATLHSERLIA